jgi:hypothetical protein
MKNYTDLIEKVLQEYQEKRGDIEYRSYGEDDEKMLVVYDWDDLGEIDEMIGKELLALGEITQEELDAEQNVHCREKFVDMVGLNFGFSDEYVVCDFCYKIVPRTINYSHNIVIIDEEDIMCGDCARENPETYIDYLLENPIERANSFLPDSVIAGFGFTKLDKEYANGWYDRADSPEEAYNKLKEHYNEIIFSITSRNPFETEWVAWVRGEK